jgi:hypothetical protein
LVTLEVLIYGTVVAVQLGIVSTFYQRYPPFRSYPVASESRPNRGASRMGGVHALPLPRSHTGGTGKTLPASPAPGESGPVPEGTLERER